ncbi:FG-GAP-like repeat-containing protein [Pelagihabitans pacificus]|nr:FG-GAP-like repeat-containing protein [Pelagihabitans pacificus]
MRFPQNLQGRILLCLLLAWAFTASAQTTFTESAAAYGLNLGQNKDGGHAWSDFDNDGDLDVLVLENSSSRSFLMQNNAGIFTNVQATLAPGMLGDAAERQAAWGDLNSDGRKDFLISSHGNSSSRMAIQIFIQNADGTFGDGIGGTAPITVGRPSSATVNISPINAEGVGLFDFEGDGDLDIFFDSHNYGIELLRNNYIDHTTNTVANPAPAAMFTHITPGNGSGVVEFGLNQFATDGDYGSAADVNDDGWVDIFMRKRDENDFFLNQGGIFTNGSDVAQASNNNKGGVGLWDLDNDGDLDAVWTENDLTQIFRNDGAGIWTALGSGTFPGLPQPTNTDNGSSSDDIDALAGGDVDNDGDIDILFVGDNRSYLFINQLNSPTPAPGVVGSGTAMTFSLDLATFNNGRNGEGATMVDVDDDGDLDIYININGNANQLYINNLAAANRNNHLLVNVSEDRGANGATGGTPERVAIGTNVLIRDCAGNIVSGLRQVNGVFGHGTQSPEEVHFGLPLGENETYIIEVRYPNFHDPTDSSGFSRLIATIVAQPSTIPGTNHYDLSTTDAEIVENPNPPDAVDDLVTVPVGNTISIQISLFDNDTEPDGENFFIESVVQPAVGSVVIDDADAGLVTYTYSAGTLFPGTTFEYTITDSTVSICPALGKSDTATVTVYEPCADPSGIDSDGDGINDFCDEDDDNDGILDTIECAYSILWVNDGTTSSEEQNAIDQLEALGYSVTVVDDNVGDNADNYDVTFLYEDVISGTALSNVTNMITTAKGIVTTEPWLYDDLFGASQGATTNTNLVNIVNNGHPVTFGLSSGDNDIGDGSFHASGLASGNVLGYHPNGEVSIAVWESGDAMDTGTAPGRRVILPLGNSNGGFNAAGQTLLVNAIIWAASGNPSCDSDADGVNDDLDLDSDNDGIYDAVEAGHGAPHTNGRLSGNVGLDGVSDAIQASGQENSGLVNYIQLDSDTDGNYDYLEFDSDNDGCNDADEAYANPDADSDNNGMYGSGTPAVNPDGTVVTASYPTPADGDGNTVFDYLEVGMAPSITTQPLDTTICPGCIGTISVVANDADTFQWQIFNGSIWVDLNDAGIYGGTATNSLVITNPTTADNGNQYRVLVSNTAYACSLETSNPVTLIVQVATVITNRRITYRVSRN